ncbi:unnamed protein product [Caretta caretta]
MKDKNIFSTSRSSSCPPACYQKATKNVPEMSEQAVTYVDLIFNAPSEQNKKQRAKNTRAKGSSAPSSVWRLIIMILGIFFLALLIAVGFFSVKGWKSLCPEHWFQHGKKCYCFSTGYKPWLESRKACSSHGSRLLLIEDKEELDFVNPLAAFRWIGLSRDKTYRPWMWGNGTALSTDWFTVTHHGTVQHCVLFLSRGAKSNSCDEPNPCICEKKAVHPEPTALSEQG